MTIKIMDIINIKGKPWHKPNDDVALSTVATMGQVLLTSQGVSRPAVLVHMPLNLLLVLSA